MIDARWFASLGAPLGPEARAATAVLVDALPVAGVAVERVGGAAEALRALRAIDVEGTWWDVEETAREALWERAAERLGEDGLGDRLARADGSLGARLRAMQLPPVLASEPLLADAAREAALLVVHQAELLEAAQATDHWLAAKHALFAAGHWMLGVRTGRIVLF